MSVRAAIGRALRHDRWVIGLARSCEVDLVGAVTRLRACGPGDVTWIEPTGAGHYLADPHVAMTDHGLVLAFEVFDFATSTGHVELRLTEPEPPFVARAGAELREPFHLSYPGLVCRDGLLWMVPEMASCTEQRAYPIEVGRGELAVGEGRALPGLAALVDPNVVSTGDGVVVWGTRDGDDRLERWSATDLFENWRRNPLGAEHDEARGGGAAQVDASGAHVRLCQRHDDGYGSTVRVQMLADDGTGRWRSSFGPEIGPDDVGRGVRLHTLTLTDGVLAFDVLERRGALRDPAVIRHKLRMANRHFRTGNGIRS